METKAFNPEMLLVARNYNGISQTEAARKCNISQGLYSKIENGVTIPDRSDNIYDKFSSKFGFPRKFFFKSARAIGLPASFHEMYRKPKSVSGKKLLAQVSSDLSIRMMCISSLLNSVDLEPLLPLPYYDAEDHSNDGAEIARKVRRTWMIPDGPIHNLTELAEKAGIIVYPSYFPAPRVDGVTINSPHMPPVIFINAASPADRGRFSLAHELGHVIMHRQMSNTMEEEANAFASELLMPEKEMRGEFSNRIDLRELARLKRIRKVSMAALLYKASEIGKLSKHQSGYLWRQMSKYRTQEPESTQFEKEKPATLKSILNLFTENLGYTESDLAETFALDSDMVKFLFTDIIQSERKLKLVVR